jgi:hypothetical protein
MNTLGDNEFWVSFIIVGNSLKFYERKCFGRKKLVGLPIHGWANIKGERLGGTDVRKCDINTTITVLTILQLWVILWYWKFGDFFFFWKEKEKILFESTLDLIVKIP